MNYYPGQGLTIGAAILGSPLGQVYDTTAGITICRIHGIILTPEGVPPGAVGNPRINDGAWKGVTVTANLSVADAVGTNIIGVDKISKSTSDGGYFEFNVIQGLTVIVSCPSFGKTVTVNTTGLTDIDVSASF